MNTDNFHKKAIDRSSKLINNVDRGNEIVNEYIASKPKIATMTLVSQVDSNVNLSCKTWHENDE